MGFIYKITNQTNHHAYVGQTIRTIDEGWGEHKRHISHLPNLALSQALIKYGTDNFIIEQIEECNNEIINEREEYWINFFNTFLGDGYNMTTGGTTNRNEPKMKKVIQYSLTGIEINRFKSLAAAQRETEVEYSPISKCCNHDGYYTAGGFIWRWDSEPLKEGEIELVFTNKAKKLADGKKKSQIANSNKVAQIDLKSGQIIGIFESYAAASSVTKVSSSTICNDCRKQKVTSQFTRSFIFQLYNNLQESPFYKGDDINA